MPIIVARRQIVTAQRLTIAAMVAAASFAIFQVNVPFAGGDLADYNAYFRKSKTMRKNWLCNYCNRFGCVNCLGSLRRHLPLKPYNFQHYKF